MRLQYRNDRKQKWSLVKPQREMVSVIITRYTNDATGLKCRKKQLEYKMDVNFLNGFAVLYE